MGVWPSCAARSADATRGAASDPLRIAEIHTWRSGGAIGVTFAPGKKQADGLTGAHDRDLQADLDIVAAWGASVVLTLVEDHELEALRIQAIGREVRRRHMAWAHWPIPDVEAPDAAFDEAWPTRSAALRRVIDCGGRVLVHCKGGLGRAGTIAARLLVEMGTAPIEAIRMVRHARPGAIETIEQARWVARGHAQRWALGPQDDLAIRDRARGALLGLAVGDAVGTALEFEAKPDYALIDDMVGGGPFDLAPGHWTDDTAMALALADSLLADPELNAWDLMKRFVAWESEGRYSCTGACFDIGMQTREALMHFERTGEAFAGPTDEARSGNGALMRLAPVAIRHWADDVRRRAAAERQTRTTHGSASTLLASRVYADLIAGAIAGRPLPTLLGEMPADLQAGWRGAHRDRVRGTGYVMDALNAALWAVARAPDFESTVLFAANLGEDADTTAAIAGQLAGAVHGATGIPVAWLSRLAWADKITRVADRLLDAAGTQ